jgi:hypothetical protein
MTICDATERALATWRNMEQRIIDLLAVDIAAGGIPYNHICLHPDAAHGRTKIDTPYGVLTILLDDRLPPDRFWFGWAPIS